MAILLTERWPKTPEPTAPRDVPAPGYRGDQAREAREAPEAPEEEAQHVLGEMAALLHDSRPGVLVGGAAAGAIALGTAIEAAALPLISRTGPGVAVVGILFLILVLCLLRTVTLFVMSGLPLGRVLDEQRVRTGAPLDPRARWATIPAPGDVPGLPWGWDRAYLLLSQARFRAERNPGRDELGSRHDRRVPGLHRGAGFHPLNRARARPLVRSRVVVHGGYQGRADAARLARHR